MSLRRAKIVCTLGPSTDSKDAIRSLVRAGMDVARLNFSHGAHGEHERRLRLVREVSAELGKPVAILQDLCGPKIRTAEKVPKEVRAGDTVRLVAGSVGNEQSITVDYPSLVAEVRKGDRILLADGHIELTVESVQGTEVLCRVETGGALRSRMGVNLPSANLSVSPLTEDDKEDLRFGLAIGVDYLGLSFVRHPKDVAELRSVCQSLGRPTPVVAKIETPSAMDRLEDIVKAADALMVARGDLGVELPPECVPVKQREIIGTCRKHRKPVIVATEMLQSMVDAPRPTRAEASDVAGAVFGGADAVMLSAETAMGKYPEQACRMMDRIIREAEGSQFFVPIASEPGATTLHAVSQAACNIAREVNAKLVVALTESGSTARIVSKARPTVPIIAFSPHEETVRRLSLYWGVTPKQSPNTSDFEGRVQSISKMLEADKLIGSGERYVIVYGVNVGVLGATNALRVEQLP